MPITILKPWFISAFLLCCFFSISLHANAQGKGRIEGVLTDTSANPVVYATVTVFDAVDTTVVSYRLSDETGRFRVPGLPAGTKLRVVISASGFEVFRKEFTLSADSANLDLGKIKMGTSITELDDVLVVAERPPVVVRRDTIEFNAASFKTLPTALVEDLLKKMPGVDVDREGNITVNGRRVNRLLVEGKEFFGSDPKIASKNLPANLIDKVQVTDDKEQLAQNPDLAAGDVGQVINLKLKKSIKQGWFGKLYAGAGTRDRYEAGGIANLFRDTLQVSLLGFSNNLSRSGFGFQDIFTIGGFNRSDINSINIGSDGAIAINDISFGGMGQGIQTASGAGVNVNTVLNNKSTLGIQYFWGNNRSVTGNRSNTRQFLGDTTLTINNESFGVSREISHRFSAFLKSKLDSFTTLEFRPSFGFIDNSATTTSSSLSGTNFDPQLNQGMNDENATSDGFNMRHQVTLNRQFRKKGRSLYFNGNMDYYQNDLSQYNDGSNLFFKTGHAITLNQLREQDQRRVNWGLNGNYTEPFTARLSLRLSQRLESLNTKEYVDTWQRDPNSGEYAVPDAGLTNGLRRKGYRSVTGTAIIYNIKKWTFTPGLALHLLDINNEFRKDPELRQSFSYILPSLNIRLGRYSFNYQASVSEPGVADLQPTVNNSNPLFITLGNPSLKPTINHGLGLNAFVNNVKKLLTLNVNINATLSENAIIQTRTVDEDGVQVTMPLNVDGVKRLTSSVTVSKQYRLSKVIKLSTRLNLYGTYNHGLLNINGVRSTTDNIYFMPSAQASINYNDKVELMQRYAPNYSKSTYGGNLYPGLSVWRHLAATELVLRMPKKIVWEASLDYSFNPQVAPAIAKSAARLNAGVNLLMFREDKGQLKLSVYDLLNQNIAVTRTIRENYIRDAETVIQRRYLLLTFTYNIRNFGGKVGGSNRLLMF
ncbi:MAG: TonB-dependent receptor [Chitinophagaceae bacterium]|nr:MAG: TonB-dependent receptor [Chitinophagaceae bacterium]